MKILILNCRRAESSPSPSLGIDAWWASCFQSSMQLIGLVDQLSLHIWQDGDHRGREPEETIVDRSTDLASGCFSFSSTWCRSLLLSFSICYLGILSLEGAINCILAQTSHQRTTSEKRTKFLLPKCPLFGGSTVFHSGALLQFKGGKCTRMAFDWWNAVDVLQELRQKTTTMCME